MRLHVDRGDAVELSNDARVIGSTWMSSMFAMRRFSGRVTPCIAPMIAVFVPQKIAQRQAAGQRVRIGIVVEQNEDLSASAK